ncbi:hypothetical protein AMTR_s00001p00269780 [Amborella trichopoda]|uniref:Uncharacterized protein n=1 Tax=Amborella trichopoda TaxID=13333 RepID=W1NMR4_AMBTC|nr:hypothetical protein AMTR_s00001p00269780 [Amborella trichopoda]
MKKKKQSAEQGWEKKVILYPTMVLVTIITLAAAALMEDQKASHAKDASITLPISNPNATTLVVSGSQDLFNKCQVMSLGSRRWRLRRMVVAYQTSSILVWVTLSTWTTKIIQLNIMKSMLNCPFVLALRLFHDLLPDPRFEVASRVFDLLPNPAHRKGFHVSHDLLVDPYFEVELSALDLLPIIVTDSKCPATYE